jgi:two-component system, OmpR family, phosphate regulon sensor histidine kinase PhoR
MPQLQLPLSPELVAVIDAIGLPVVLLDAQGAVLAASAAMHRVVTPVAVGKPLSFALRDPDLIATIDDVASGAPDGIIEIAERVPVERLFRVHLRAIATPGQRRPVMLTFEDLTQQRSTERMRVDFVANASHELRTPLASLLGFVETLQGPARNDLKARERFLGIMREQALRMSRLVDDLLSLSRIELKAHLVPDTPVDLVAILREIIDSLAVVAAERGVKVAIVTAQAVIRVPGDRDELLRLAENLVENAIKYGGRGGAVTISLGTAGREAILAVADNGPGITSEHLPRLTERFYRVDTAASKEAGGTGLGLAIVKHIVVRHRGRLDIESLAGRGSTFRVVLPLSS